MIADLRARGLTGDARIDTGNADLSATASQGLTQLDLIIQHTDVVASASASHSQALT